MTTETISLTRQQARLWIRAILAAGGLHRAEARQMTRGLTVGDVLVYSDWTDGRVEITVEETHP